MSNKKSVTSKETQGSVVTSEETLEKTVTPEGTQEERELTTTEKLFGVTTEDGEKENSTEEVVKEEAKTEEEVVKEPENKIQVEGHGEVSMEDLIKNFKTSKEIGDARNSLSEYKKGIETLKEEMQKSLEKSKQQESNTEESDEGYIDTKAEIEINSLKETVKNLGELVNGVNESTADVQYEASIKSLNKELEAQGFPDFMDYKDKVESKVKSEIEGLPKEQQQGKWTMPYFSEVYKSLKLQDLMSGNEPEKKETPKVDERATAKVIPIESSGGKASDVDDSASIYQAQFDKAKTSGKTEDWQEVFRLKDIAGYK